MTMQIFQSTLPVKGATITKADLERLERISIHAPRKGSDTEWKIILTFFAIFQSSLPVKGATGFNMKKTIVINISIHAPRKGSDILK